MKWLRLPHGPRRTLTHAGNGDGGFMLITAVMLMSVMASLTLVMVTNTDHLDYGTLKARSSGQAMQVAESGVQVAIAKLRQAPNTLPSGTQTGSTAEGSYAYTVSQNGSQFIVTSSGTVGLGRLASTRRIQVTLSAPTNFQYAIVSYDQVNLSDNTTINGDIFGNQSLVLGNNMHLFGSVTSALGSVSGGSNTDIHGNVWTGGYNGANGRAVDLTSGTVSITGNVVASPSNCATADATQYKVNGSGTIGGSVTTWNLGPVSPNPAGGFAVHVCTTAPAPIQIPTFTWNAANYTNAHEMTVAQFATWLAANSNNVQGAFHIIDGGATNWVNLKGVTITGDFVLMADQAPIESNTVTFTNTQKTIIIGSGFSPANNAACTDAEFQSDQPAVCAIGLRDNFRTNAFNDTLIYAPNGPIAMRDNTTIVGAVYGEGVKLRDNMNITYNPNIASLPGFGNTSLAQQKWVELPN